jgi:hypothetical protein
MRIKKKQDYPLIFEMRLALVTNARIPVKIKLAQNVGVKIKAQIFFFWGTFCHKDRFAVLNKKFSFVRYSRSHSFVIHRVFV